MDAAVGIARVAGHLRFEQGNSRMRRIVEVFVSTVAITPAMAVGNATEGQNDFTPGLTDTDSSL